MSPTYDDATVMEAGTRYEIVVSGTLGPRSVNAIGAVEVVGVGPSGTTLGGFFVDQSALHGVLERIRDLGIELVEVRRVA